MIRENQALYYDVLAKCDKLGDCTPFVEFSLKQILTALKSYTDTSSPLPVGPSSRMEYALSELGDGWFSRKDYLKIHKDISTATASRDLQKATAEKILLKVGLANQVKYKLRSRP